MNVILMGTALFRAPVTSSGWKAPEEITLSGDSVAVQEMGAAEAAGTAGAECTVANSRNAADEAVTVSGIVKDIRPGRKTYSVRLRTDEEETLLLLVKREDVPKAGNRVIVSGTVWPFETPGNPGQFDEEEYYRSLGCDGRISVDSLEITDSGTFWWKETLGKFAGRLSDVWQKLIPEQSGVLTAMLTGDKSGLPDETQKLYQQNGISHVLAISGLHVTLLAGILLLILKMVRFPFILSDSLVIFFLFSYGTLVGFPVSAKRAVLMSALMVGARMAGRTYDLPTALSCAGVWILLPYPGMLFQPGFQLSFGSVLGIYLLFPFFQTKIHYTKKKQKNVRVKLGEVILNMGHTVTAGLGVSQSVMIFTLPLQLWHFSEVSLVGVVWNLIVIPLLPLVLLTGLFGGIAGMFLPVAGKFLLASTSAILNLYEWLCRFGSHFPFYTMILGKPALWQVVCYYAVLAVLVALERKRGRRQQDREKQGEIVSGEVAALFSPVLRQIVWLALLLPLMGIRSPELSVTMLDVGQGDGILVRQAGECFLVDCGSSNVSEVGKYRLISFLKSEGVRELDTVFITHMDSDHVSGVLELLEQRDILVGQIVLSPVYERTPELWNENYEELLRLADEYEIPVCYPKPGTVFGDGGIQIKCLYPGEPEEDSAVETAEKETEKEIEGRAEELERSKTPETAVIRKKTVDQNSASLVLRLETKSFVMLLTGDCGQPEEQEILENYESEELSCQILKVPHHGSKNSSSEEFLNACQPAWALISCGERNRYGHPHEETLRRLSEAGCRSYSTARNGALRIRVRRGGEVELWGYKH